MQKGILGTTRRKKNIIEYKKTKYFLYANIPYMTAKLKQQTRKDTDEKQFNIFNTHTIPINL